MRPSLAAKTRLTLRVHIVCVCKRAFARRRGRAPRLSMGLKVSSFRLGSGHFASAGVCVRVAMVCVRWHCGLMVTASRSLKKRQELRQHLEEEQQKLRDRKKKLNSLLSLIDQREKLDEKIGEASQEIIDLGESKELVRELVGVSQRDFNDMLGAASDSSPSAEDSSGDHEGQDNEEAASASEGAGGEDDHASDGQ